jgi:hypothetical protein
MKKAKRRRAHDHVMYRTRKDRNCVRVLRGGTLTVDGEFHAPHGGGDGNDRIRHSAGDGRGVWAQRGVEVQTWRSQDSWTPQTKRKRGHTTCTKVR